MIEAMELYRRPGPRMPSCRFVHCMLDQDPLDFPRNTNSGHYMSIQAYCHDHAMYKDLATDSPLPLPLPCDESDSQLICTQEFSLMTKGEFCVHKKKELLKYHYSCEDRDCTPRDCQIFKCKNELKKNSCSFSNVCLKFSGIHV